jgi:cytochrome c oxidase subunit IV
MKLIEVEQKLLELNQPVLQTRVVSLDRTHILKNFLEIILFIISILTYFLDLKPQAYLRWQRQRKHL